MKMHGQKSYGKLTRTQSSSLLRSSPTFRSSIHSLSSINEDDHAVFSSDDEEQDKKSKKIKNTHGLFRFRPGFLVIACFILLFVTFFVFRSGRKDEKSVSENLLLALIFIAAVLFVVIKNKSVIRQIVAVLKHSCGENVKRLGFCSKSTGNDKPVCWFIGDSATAKKVGNEDVEVYSTGDLYEGEFHKGRANGSGVYNFYVNGRYEGDWIDGKYDGFGIESWARGSRYIGQYRQGMRHGFGVYKFYTGDSYAGEWCNGQSHGFGAQTCSDCSYYVGEFKCGAKHGLGCYHFRNGDRYSGEYFNDKVHGFGVYHFTNGHCYEGSWHEGRKQGFGMYTFRSGEAKCGEWDLNTIKTHFPPLTDSVLRAVQGARRAAENAISLQSLEEQVNKSVMAANRAATAARVAAIKAVQNHMDGGFCNTF